MKHALLDLYLYKGVFVSTLLNTFVKSRLQGTFTFIYRDILRPFDSCDGSKELIVGGESRRSGGAKSL